MHILSTSWSKGDNAPWMCCYDINRLAHSVSFCHSYNTYIFHFHTLLIFISILQIFIEVWVPHLKCHGLMGVRLSVIYNYWMCPFVCFRNCKITWCVSIALISKKESATMAIFFIYYPAFFARNTDSPRESISLLCGI